MRLALPILQCLFIVPALALVSGVTWASNSGVTYQGRILKPDGSPLSGANTQFKLQLRTPDSQNCLMYEEVQSLDLRNSNGAFSLTINDGNGARTDTTGLALDQVFANRGTSTFSLATCSAGPGSYTPNPADGRNLVVLFKDETMAAYEPMPAQKINFVPFAFETKQIAGLTPESLVRVADGATLGNVSPLSNANYTELLALVNGTSTQYTKQSASAGSVVTIVGGTGNVATPSAGSVWLDTTAGNLKFYDGTTVKTVGTSGGSVSSVATGTGLTGGPITSTGTISLATTGAGGTGFKVTYDTYGRVTAAVALVEADIPTLSTAGKVSGSAITSGTIGGSTAINTTGTITTPALSATSVGTQSVQIFETTNNFKVTLQAPAALGANYALTLPTTAGLSGQVMQSNGSGVMTWITPLSSSTGFVNGGNSFGAPSSLGNNDNFDLNVETNNLARMTVTAAGSVGIGTTAPTNIFTVVGGDALINGVRVGASANTNQNTVVGNGSMSSLTTGSGNSAFGAGALSALTTGQSNTSLGRNSQNGTSTGQFSTSVGYNALQYGNHSNDTVVGAQSLSSAVYASGGANTVLGAGAMTAVTSASNNVAVGYQSGTTLTSGANNVVIGTNVTVPNPAGNYQLNIGNTIYADMSAGNVGIGTTAPVRLLHVNGPMRLQPAALPGTPAAGDIAVDSSSSNALKWYNGTSWQTVNTVSGSLSSVSSISNSSGNITLAPATGTGSVIVNSGLAATSSTTGALSVTGGVGVSGDIYAGNSINAGTTLSVGTNGFIPQLYGSSASSGSIKIDGTSNATKGNVLLASAGGGVGIGTTSPAYALDVVGTIQSSVGVRTGWVSSQLSYNNAHIDFNDSSKYIGFGTNSLDRMRIDSSGNVGIGTTLPTALIDVKVPVGGGTLSSFHRSDGLQIGYFSTNDSFTNTFAWGNNGGGTYNFTVDGSGNTSAASFASGNSFYLSAPVLNSMAIKTGGTERMRVDSTENVGIGTTAPGSTLEVSRSSAASSSSTGISLTTPTNLATDSSWIGLNNRGTIGYDGSRQSLDLGAAAAKIITFDTNGIGVANERMRIDLAGNVGIGTTGPALKFDVGGSAIFRGPTVGGIDGELYYDTASHSYQFYNSGAAAWQALGTGTITYTGTLWNQNGANLNYTAGNVGMGTATPGSALSALNASFGTYASTAAPPNGLIVSGNAGFGISNPTNPIDVKGVIRFNGLTSGGIGMTAPSTGASGTITLPPVDGTNGQVLKTNGAGQWGWVTPVSGTVTSTTATAPLSVATGTTTPVVSIAAGTVAGQTLRWNGSNWVSTKMIYTDLVNSSALSPWPASCTAGQGLTYSTVSDAFSCVTLVGGATSGIANGGNTIGANISIGTNDAFSASLRTGGSDRLTITSAGNVGIGTTSPGTLLDVQASDFSAGMNVTNTSSTSSRFPAIYVKNFMGATTGSPAFSLYNMGGSSTSPTALLNNRNLGSVGFYGASDTSGNALPGATIKAVSQQAFSSSAAGTYLAFSTTPLNTTAVAEAMRIDSTGNVGIGTTAPQAKLDINGFMRMSTNTAAPAACSATINGSLALTSLFTTCACKGASTAWVSTVDGTTACVWQ